MFLLLRNPTLEYVDEKRLPAWSGRLCCPTLLGGVDYLTVVGGKKGWRNVARREQKREHELVKVVRGNDDE